MARPRGKQKKQTPVSKAVDKSQLGNLTCPICDKTFKKQGSLTRHVNLHDELKDVEFHDDEVAPDDRFPCSECSKVFTRNSSLVRHMKTHSSISSVNVDDDCDNLNFETDKEEDLFPYECPDCWECFTEERFLIAHSKTHNTSRSYSCKICNSTFSHRPALNRHILTHTSSKQFKCKFCNATFNDVSSRSKHARMHLMSCGMCGCSFENLNDFYTHVNNFHRNKSSKAAALQSKEPGSDESFQGSDEERNAVSFEESFEDSESDTADQNLNAEKLLKCAKNNMGCEVSKQQKFSRVGVFQNFKAENKSDFYMCLECKIKFNSKTALQEHSMNCSLLRYMCSSSQCKNTSFRNKAEFLHHMEIKHHSSPKAKEKVLPVKTNTNEAIKNGQVLDSTFIPLNENAGSILSYVIPNTSGNQRDASCSTSTANESFYVSSKPEAYQFSNNVVSNIVQPSIYNQAMMLDPLLMSTGFVPQQLCPTTAYIDFNIESYIPWFQKFLDLIKSCEYPLQYDLFERLSHCLKIISNIIGRPLTKMTEQQNFALLLKLHEEFSKISERHLKHIAKNIFK